MARKRYVKNFGNMFKYHRAQIINMGSFFSCFITLSQDQKHLFCHARKIFPGNLFFNQCACLTHSFWHPHQPLHQNVQYQLNSFGRYIKKENSCYILTYLVDENLLLPELMQISNAHWISMSILQFRKSYFGRLTNQ